MLTDGGGEKKKTTKKQKAILIRGGKQRFSARPWGIGGGGASESRNSTLATEGNLMALFFKHLKQKHSYRSDLKLQMWTARFLPLFLLSSYNGSRWKEYMTHRGNCVFISLHPLKQDVGVNSHNLWCLTYKRKLAVTFSFFFFFVISYFQPWLPGWQESLCNWHKYICSKPKNRKK